MSTTIASRPASCRPKFHTTSPRFTRHRVAFARSAVFDEFRNRDARAIDQGSFRDRRPSGGPVLVGQVAAQVACTAGRAAVDHWLSVAARSNGKEREAALKIAYTIAKRFGFPWRETEREGAA